jgi:hypothetical protein
MHSGQRRAQTALPLSKEPLIPIWLEAVSNLRAVWRLFWREKSCTPEIETRFSGRQACSLIIIFCELLGPQYVLLKIVVILLSAVTFNDIIMKQKII